MKVIIIGNRYENYLTLVKFVKDVTGLGLKESKELCDSTIKLNKQMVLDVIDYNTTIELFNKNLLGHGLTIRKYRKDIIQKFLRENDENYDIKSDDEYLIYLELFDFLFKNDKESLRNSMNEAVDKCKKKLDEWKI